MKNYFQWSKDNPYHISIGGVVRNKEHKIGCHYFKSFSHPSVGKFEDFYILMRETLEKNETIETCLVRGFREEFGAEIKLVGYVGAIEASIQTNRKNMYKTTLYFLCDLVTFDESSRDPEDIESSSAIQWHEPKFLINKMQEQGKRLGREDMDESKVIKNMLNLGI